VKALVGRLFCRCDRIDGRVVTVDIPPTPTSATESSSANTERVSIEKPSLPSTAFTKTLSPPADRECDNVAVGGPSRQSYASVVSPRRDGPRDNAVGDAELPCPGW